jgi:hypothetical protein
MAVVILATIRLIKRSRRRRGASAIRIIALLRA